MSRLPKFDGKRASFLAFHKRVVSHAISGTIVRSYGLAASVLSEKDFMKKFPAVAITGEYAEQVPSIPDPPSAKTATDVYKVRMEEYRSYNSDLMAFRRDLLDALPEAAIQQLSNSDHFGTMTVKEILDFMVLEYGTVTFADAHGELVKLHAAYPEDADVDDIIVEHQRIHGVLAATCIPRHDFDKVLALQVATANMGSLARVWAKFFEDFPRLHDQKFDTLVKRCREAKHNATSPPAAGNPFAAAATSPPFCLPAQQQQNQNQNQKRNVSGAREGRPKKSENGSTPGSVPLPRPADYAHCSHYCHRHGFGYHDGSSCRSDLTDEQRRATAINTMGGSMKIAERRA
jgi:hypothetical protein